MIDQFMQRLAKIWFDDINIVLLFISLLTDFFHFVAIVGVAFSTKQEVPISRSVLHD